MGFCRIWGIQLEIWLGKTSKSGLIWTNVLCVSLQLAAFISVVLSLLIHQFERVIGRVVAHTRSCIY